MEPFDSVKSSLSQMDASLTDLVLNPKSKKIARPPNAFMIFAREHRKNFASQNPNQNNKFISKLLGEAWRKVDFRTKKMYYDKAKLLEDLHRQKFPDYAYSPRIARIQKIKRKIRKEQLKNMGNSPIDENEEDTKHVISSDIEREELKDDNVSTSKGKWKKSPEYVPNNPDYFATSETSSVQADREDPVPYHEQYSFRSSSSSLCSVPEARTAHCPDYSHYPNPHSACNCTNCWKDRPFEPSYTNLHSRGYDPDYMHSRNPELDSFKPPLPAQFPCCPTSSMSAQRCTSSCYRNYFGFREPQNNQAWYNPMPWQQYAPWKPPSEDPYCYQNMDFYRTRNANYCGTNTPHRYPAFDHLHSHGAYNSMKFMEGSRMPPPHFPPSYDADRFPVNSGTSCSMNHFANNGPTSTVTACSRDTANATGDAQHADPAINQNPGIGDM